MTALDRMLDGFGQVDATLKTVIEGGVLAIAAFLIVVIVIALLLVAAIVRYSHAAHQRNDALLKRLLEMQGTVGEERRALAQIVENNTAAVSGIIEFVKSSHKELVDTIVNLQGAMALFTSKQGEVVNSIRDWPKLVTDTLQLQNEALERQHKSYQELVSQIQTNRDATSRRFHDAEAAWAKIGEKLDTLMERSQPEGIGHEQP